jgi:hypothetical protein
MMEVLRPLPPFTHETAVEKVRGAENVGILATPIGYHWPIRSIVRGETAPSSFTADRKSSSFYRVSGIRSSNTD